MRARLALPLVRLGRKLHDFALGPPLAIAAYFASAVLFFTWQEGWSHLDSFYFAVMVFTTIGYGDLAPATPGGKLATCFFALGAVALITKSVEQVLSGIASTSVLSLAKQRCFGHTESWEPADVGVRKRRRLRMLGLATLGLLLVNCAVGRFIVGAGDWCDCLYFSVVTITTIGFGDIVPSTPLARLSTAASAVLIVPLFASTLGSYIEQRQSAGEVLVRVKGSLEAERFAALFPDKTCASRSLLQLQAPVQVKGSLEAEQLSALAHFGHEMCTEALSREDFLVFVLLRNGIVSREEIHTVWEDFARLDLDADGRVLVNKLEEGAVPSASKLL